MSGNNGKVHGATFGKVPPELMHDPAITDGAVRLYAHMHWRYGQNQSNFEGQVSMAKYLHVTPLTIAHRIDELESHDWVVVIYRGKNKTTGNYTTPFYHVFTSTEECRLFRENYACDEGETLLPKPAKMVRKSRKGVGGKPSHQLNSAIGGDHPNSSIGGGVNSSLYDSDSGYPDSVKEKDSVPNGTAGGKTEPASPSPNLTPKPKAARPIFDLVAHYSFGVNGGGVDKTAGRRIGMIEKYLKEQQATVEQVQRFYEWYDEQNPGMNKPRVLATFAEHWVAYRESGQGYAAQPTAPVTPPPAPQPANYRVYGVSGKVIGMSADLLRDKPAGMDELDYIMQLKERG